MASIEAAKRAFAEEEAAQRRRHRTARERKGLDGGAQVLGAGGGEGSTHATVYGRARQSYIKLPVLRICLFPWPVPKMVGDLESKKKKRPQSPITSVILTLPPSPSPPLPTVPPTPFTALRLDPAFAPVLLQISEEVRRRIITIFTHGGGGGGDEGLVGATMAEGEGVEASAGSPKGAGLRPRLFACLNHFARCPRTPFETSRSLFHLRGRPMTSGEDVAY